MMSRISILFPTSSKNFDPKKKNKAKPNEEKISVEKIINEKKTIKNEMKYLIIYSDNAFSITETICPKDQSFMISFDFTPNVRYLSETKAIFSFKSVRSSVLKI